VIDDPSSLVRIKIVLFTVAGPLAGVEAVVLEAVPEVVLLDAVPEVVPLTDLAPLLLQAAVTPDRAMIMLVAQPMRAMVGRRKKNNDWTQANKLVIINECKTVRI
jgi:hypothetical protein